MSLNSFRRRRRSSGLGFTLIEVLAGLALLGTVLAAATLARARYTRQLVSADRRLEAARATERLLSGWWLDAESLPRTGEGSVPGGDGFTWQTHTTRQQAHASVEVLITRVEIFDPTAEAAGEPILAVDMVLSDGLVDDKPPDADTQNEDTDAQNEDGSA